MDVKLIKLANKLNNFFSYFKEDNILVISEDKTTLPFCYAIVDKTSPKRILLSFAVDYPTSINSVQVALLAAQITKVSLTQPFYISIHSGQTFIDDEAYKRWDLDAIDLNVIDPESKVAH